MLVFVCVSVLVLVLVCVLFLVFLPSVVCSKHSSEEPEPESSGSDSGFAIAEACVSIRTYWGSFEKSACSSLYFRFWFLTMCVLPLLCSSCSGIYHQYCNQILEYLSLLLDD